MKKGKWKVTLLLIELTGRTGGRRKDRKLPKWSTLIPTLRKPTSKPSCVRFMIRFVLSIFRDNARKALLAILHTEIKN